nr:UDP-N-acetylmuramate dehydrogenase [Shigella flexneri]
MVCAEDEQQLLNAWQHATAEGQPVLILGEGSNVLFLEDYRGTVIINRIKGIEIHDEPDAWYLHVGAEKLASPGKIHFAGSMPGLENLALIPGCVGSSPIQNIGAYGVELQRVCAYVDCVELATGKQVRLTAKELPFWLSRQYF